MSMVARVLIDSTNNSVSEGLESCKKTTKSKKEKKDKKMRV